MIKNRMNSSTEFKDTNITKDLLDAMWYDNAHIGLDCIASWYGGEVYDYIQSLYTNKPQGPKRRVYKGD